MNFIKELIQKIKNMFIKVEFLDLSLEKRLGASYLNFYNSKNKNKKS